MPKLFFWGTFCFGLSADVPRTSFKNVPVTFTCGPLRDVQIRSFKNVPLTFAFGLSPLLTNSVTSIPGVFNRGSTTPRGSAEVLQGVRQIISSEAFFPLPKMKNVQKTT